ncbi:transferase [Syncephalis pseudoplumigaleata]|uniref:Transferase n=1 Tax=Syncephalis pseudoplumigaleata TaxID=1712513 RepID=A0A4P9Z234_9FUNG|nr:transferase [Syncephalis pseudoplumigaleata]|eukprot:RKP26563.1 transferase [Syncephalis pseudoplumigaleata]
MADKIIAEHWLLPTGKEHAQIKYQSSDTDYSPTLAHTQRLFIYKNHDKRADFMPTEKLLDGLRKTIDQYPILATRLVVLENGDIEMHPSAEGVRYRESQCDKDIAAFNPSWPLSCIPPEWRATSWKAEKDMPVAIHVTRFANNSGLVICLSGNHQIADGNGWSMLIQAWAAFTRGETPAPPVHDRQLLRLPEEHRHLLKRGGPELLQKLIVLLKHVERRHVLLRFRADKLAQLKADAVASLTDEERASGWFSTLDATIVMLWRASVRARTAVPDDKILAETAALNMRHRLPDLPRNYFANAVDAPRMTVTAGEMRRSTIGTLALKRRREANNFQFASKEEWIIRASSGEFASILNPNAYFDHGFDMACTDWSKFGYYTDTDFGYGNPVCCRYCSPPSNNLWVVFEGQPDGASGSKPNGLDIALAIEDDAYERFLADSDIVKYAEFLG